MLQDYLWFIYALGAAILWGLQYATIEQLLVTIPAPLITLAYTVAIGITYLIGFAWLQPTLPTDQIKTYLTFKNLALFGLVVFLGCLGTLLIFSAISKETATKASLIEITYPFFVALFAALVYQTDALNWQTFVGGSLIVTGVMIILQS